VIWGDSTDSTVAVGVRLEMVATKADRKATELGSTVGVS
jgi:hypothetical protein